MKSACPNGHVSVLGYPTSLTRPHLPSKTLGLSHPGWFSLSYIVAGWSYLFHVERLKIQQWMLLPSGGQSIRRDLRTNGFQIQHLCLGGGASEQNESSDGRLVQPWMSTKLQQRYLASQTCQSVSRSCFLNCAFQQPFEVSV